MPFPILWGLKCRSAGEGGCRGKKKNMAHLSQWKSHTCVVNKCAGTLPAMRKLLLVWRSGSRMRGRVTEFDSLNETWVPKDDFTRDSPELPKCRILVFSLIWTPSTVKLFFVKAEMWCLGACHLICVVKFANTLCVCQVDLLTLFHWCLSQQDMPGESHDLA